MNLVIAVWQDFVRTKRCLSVRLCPDRLGPALLGPASARAPRARGLDSVGQVAANLEGWHLKKGQEERRGARARTKPCDSETLCPDMPLLIRKTLSGQSVAGSKDFVRRVPVMFSPIIRYLRLS